MYVRIFFVLITLATAFLFYRAVNHSKATLLILASWLLLQYKIGTSGFYTVTDRVPPRFLLLVLPPLMLIIVALVSRRGWLYLDHLNIKILTLLHTVRIGVEMILLLFVHKTVPQSMTFEGSNFDILSGISAPVIYYFRYVRKTLSKSLILIWEFCLPGITNEYCCYCNSILAFSVSAICI